MFRRPLLWIIHSQIGFGALPPEESLVFRVPAHSNLRQSFCVRTPLETERGRQKKAAIRERCTRAENKKNKKTNAVKQECTLPPEKRRQANAGRYSLTRPQWGTQSSAQHVECGLRKAVDGSPAGDKRTFKSTFLRARKSQAGQQKARGKKVEASGF